MTDYAELVKKLRELAAIPAHCENVASCDDCTKEDICMSFTNERIIKTTNAAADAIENLSKPKWIPVTARFPETESGDTSKPVLVTDGDCVAIAEWFNFELCDPYWSYTGIGDITHWQPLPEPPKEG